MISTVFHMIPNAILNKWVQSLKGERNLWSLKIYNCSFIPNCTRKIMWLLVNNIRTKISSELLFICCPSANAPPTCIWVVSKMTSLIDIHVHMFRIKTCEKYISLKRASLQITKQNFKSMLKEVWRQSPSTACFWTDWISGTRALQTVQTGVF